MLLSKRGRATYTPVRPDPKSAHLPCIWLPYCTFQAPSPVVRLEYLSNFLGYIWSPYPSCWFSFLPLPCSFQQPFPSAMEPISHILVATTVAFLIILIFQFFYLHSATKIPWSSLLKIFEVKLRRTHLYLLCCFLFHAVAGISLLIAAIVRLRTKDDYRTARICTIVCLAITLCSFMGFLVCLKGNISGLG